MSAGTFTRTSVLAHKDFIETVRFCPDGSRLLTSGLRGGIKVWDMTRRTLFGKLRPARIKSFKHHCGNFRDIVFTPDSRLAIAYGSNWTEVWDIATGRLFLDLKVGDEEYQLLTMGGRMMVTEASWCHGGLRLWDLREGKALATLKLQGERITPNYHPAMEDMTQDEIDTHTPSAMITGVMLIGDDKLAVASENHKTFIFDLQDHKLERVLAQALIAVHHNGRVAFAAGSSDKLSVIDLYADFQVIAGLDRAIGNLGKMATTCDGLLATARGNDLMIWRMENWDCARKFENVHSSQDETEADRVRINELLMLSDGVHLATSSRSDPLPRLFDLGTINALDLPEIDAAHQGGIERLREYPGGGLAARSARGVQLWNGRNDGQTFVTERYCSSMDISENGLIAFADGTELVVMEPSR